jgi:hypothetical protein
MTSSPSNALRFYEYYHLTAHSQQRHTRGREETINVAPPAETRFTLRQSSVCSQVCSSPKYFCALGNVIITPMCHGLVRS